jgi:hypothetical protein
MITLYVFVSVGDTSMSFSGQDFLLATDQNRPPSMCAWLLQATGCFLVGCALGTITNHHCASTTQVPIVVSRNCNNLPFTGVAFGQGHLAIKCGHKFVGGWVGQPGHFSQKICPPAQYISFVDIDTTRTNDDVVFIECAKKATVHGLTVISYNDSHHSVHLSQ